MTRKTKASTGKTAKGARRPAGRAARSDAPRTTLLAITGMSPAVLTETVWALARPAKGAEAIIPDEVVALTTAAGARCIDEQLGQPMDAHAGRSVWQGLREEILGRAANDDPRLGLGLTIIDRSDPKTGRRRPLDDIRSQADNLAAADFILNQVKSHVTSDDTRLIASLAGGRKTMSALLHAAVTHLGRPQDRIVHILVSEPFDNPRLSPRFFYPGQPDASLELDGKRHEASSARLDLADVPFAPMRERFPDIAKIPSRFTSMVEAYSEAFQRDAARPALVEIRDDARCVVIDGRTVKLNRNEFEIIRFLFIANDNHWLDLPGIQQIDAIGLLKAHHGYEPDNTIDKSLMPLARKLYEARKNNPGPEVAKDLTPDYFKRTLSAFRVGCQQAHCSWEPPARTLRFPPFHLVRETA